MSINEPELTLLESTVCRAVEEILDERLTNIQEEVARRVTKRLQPYPYSKNSFKTNSFLTEYTDRKMFDPLAGP